MKITQCKMGMLVLDDMGHFGRVAGYGKNSLNELVVLVKFAIYDQGVGSPCESAFYVHPRDLEPYKE